MRRFFPLLVAATLAVAGCSGGSPSSSTAQPTAAASAPGASSSAPVTASTSPATRSALPTPSVRTIVIALRDGRVSPNGDRVALTRGETFVLDVTSDRADEVHVHGFEVEIKLRPGDHKKVELVADRTGRFEVESHHPELLIVELRIR